MTCPGCGAPDDQGCRKGCSECKPPRQPAPGVFKPRPHTPTVEERLKLLEARVGELEYINEYWSQATQDE